MLCLLHLCPSTLQQETSSNGAHSIQGLLLRLQRQAGQEEQQELHSAHARRCARPGWRAERRGGACRSLMGCLAARQQHSAEAAQQAFRCYSQLSAHVLLQLIWALGPASARKRSITSIAPRNVAGCCWEQCDRLVQLVELLPPAYRYNCAVACRISVQQARGSSLLSRDTCQMGLTTDSSTWIFPTFRRYLIICSFLLPAAAEPSCCHGCPGWRCCPGCRCPALPGCFR